MPVKPEASHLRTWDSASLTATFGWEDALSSKQQALLPWLRKHFIDMVEIHETCLPYDDHPQTPRYSEVDGIEYYDRLSVIVTYDADIFASDTDSMRQHLEEGIEADIVDVLFGEATIDEEGVITRPDPDTARPAHIIQV